MCNTTPLSRLCWCLLTALVVNYASGATGTDTVISTLVPAGSVWKYLDTGAAPASTWRTTNFNDSAWLAGAAQLGYGDGDEVTVVGYGPDAANKYITTYFRRSFFVPDRSVYTNLILRVLRDDGAAVYLNGVEVFRSNLAAGATGSTPATLAVSGSEEASFFPTNVNPALLLNGTNLLAVEIHQSSGGSSDISFDLELTGVERSLAPPQLTATGRQPIALAWPAPSTGFLLQSRSNLSATSAWTTLNATTSLAGTQNVAMVPAANSGFFRLRRQQVDASTLNHKLMMGYQGWFASTNDGSQPSRWVHWFRSQTPVATNATVDFWPDISELDPDELFSTGMTLPGGAPARVYAANRQKTVLRHFRWMQDNDLDGVMLQRFSSELSDPAFFSWRNQVAENVRAGAERYGRVFNIMYDISGTAESNLVQRLTNDWAYLVSTLWITNSPRYLRHNGKPVLAIWGLGFSDRPGTSQQAQQLIDYFKAGGLTVMGGVPTNWRTLTSDSKTDPAWASVYRSFDVLSPWSVGRYSTESGADSFKQNYIVPDLADANSHGIAYMPVVFPCFSWHNLNAGTLNQIPRNAGRFYWRQAYNATAAGCAMIYGAMFDEMDEGTAMLKLAPTAAEIPAQGAWVPLNIDGTALRSDWYLRLANEAGKMLRGDIPLSTAIPITQP